MKGLLISFLASASGYAWYILPAMIVVSGFVIVKRNKRAGNYTFCAGALLAIAILIVGIFDGKPSHAKIKQQATNLKSVTSTLNATTTSSTKKPPAPITDSKQAQPKVVPLDNPENPSQVTLVGHTPDQSDSSNAGVEIFSAGINLHVGLQKGKASESLEFPKNVPPARPNLSAAPANSTTLPSVQPEQTSEGHNIVQNDLALIVESCEHSGSMIDCEGFVMNNEENESLSDNNSFKFWDGTANDNNGNASSISAQEFKIDGVPLWGTASLPSGFKNKFTFRFKDPGNGTSTRLAVNLRIKWRDSYSRRTQTNILIK